MTDDTQKVIFLDRDGTLIEEKDFLTDVDDIEIFPHSSEAIGILRKLGYVIVVVSNQSGVARGYLTEQQVIEINEEIFRRLEKQDARPDLFFYCPHHPEATVAEYRVECDCRKPAPGMVRMAEKLLNIDIRTCFSIGDKLSDAQLCQNLGGKGILVLTGYGKSELEKSESTGTWPDYIADNLLDAAHWIQKILEH
ncbi:MAG: HAD-IIIA family hydrolase [Candidatus Zixiibacteriota bacterium]